MFKKILKLKNKIMSILNLGQKKKIKNEIGPVTVRLDIANNNDLTGMHVVVKKLEKNILKKHKKFQLIAERTKSARIRKKNLKRLTDSMLKSYSIYNKKIKVGRINAKKNTTRMGRENN